MGEQFYVTTPIYYVNDVPHIGHAYTTIAADVLSRYHRARGRDAYFLTGMDEHGQKVERSAQKRGVEPKRHCDEMVARFQELWALLGIKPTHFIRTTDPKHKKVVQKTLQKLFDEGLIEKRSYEGWYSTASERFLTEKEIVDGKDPDTGLPLEKINESNYFFLMSKYQEQLKDYIKQNPDFIKPKHRMNEVLGFLEQELEDLCISRPKSRLSWGIDLPFDDDYVTYVWFDALMNYLSALGLYTDDDALMKFWPANFHLIGKDILITHTIYWTPMLFAQGVSPAQHVFAHGWWTIEGRKMSKSLQNVVDPFRLIKAYGPDPVRYFLLREVPFGNDGDFSHSSLIGRINSDLANDFGNALNRAASMAIKHFDGKMPAPSGEDTENDMKLKELAMVVKTEMGFCLDEGDYIEDSERAGELAYSRALEEIWVFVRSINKYIDSEAPWKLAKDGNTGRLGTALYNALEGIRVAAVMLAPFMPGKMAETLETLGVQLTYSDENKTVADQFMFSEIDEWGVLESGVELKTDGVVFPRVEPEQIEDILQEIIALCESEELARAEFKKIFPKLKAGAIDKWMNKLYKKDAESETEKTEKKKPKKSGISEPAESVDYDDFAKLDLRVAEVLEAEKVEGSDKLLKLTVDIGEKRQIVAGIGLAFTPEELVGKKIVVIANLKPVKLMGVESRGMLLAAGEGGADLGLCELPKDRKPGTRIK